MPEAATEREPDHPRTGTDTVRDFLTLVALILGVILAAWATTASQTNFVGQRWLLIWSTVGTVGLASLVIGIGLWLGHRWAPYALAALGLAVAGAALLVASGLTARSVRLSLGGPAVPIVIALGSASLGVAAIWLTRGRRSAGLEPMTGMGAVLIGVVGTVAAAILLSSVMEGVGLIGWPILETTAVVGGAAVPFGLLLAYGAHRLAADGARWPAGFAVLVLVGVLGVTQLAPTFAVGSPAWPYVLQDAGGRSPLKEIIPGYDGGGALLTVTTVDTDVMFGIEGFFTFTRATQDGKVVLDQRVPSSGLSHRLPSGDYTLEAYIRNCDGWCGLLDPPAPLCSASGTLDAGSAYELVVSLRNATCGLRLR